MSFGKFSKSYFGSNYEKAKRNFDRATRREKLEFQRKYPSADISKFVFDADLSKTGDLLTTTTKYRNDNGELFDITGYLFKKNYLNTLHWVPKIWDVGGRAETKALIGGGGVYSYIRVLPDEFLLKSVVITVDFKRNSSGRTRVYEYAPPN